MRFWRKIKFKIKNRWNDYEYKIKFLNLLFILTILCILFVTLIINSIDMGDAFDKTSDYLWICWLFLPISISSLILGIIYRKKGYACTKNIVAGITITIILFIFGLIGIFSTKLYENNYKVVLDYGKIINFQFPNSGSVRRLYFNDININFFKIKYINEVTFKDKKSIKKMEEAITNDNRWIKKVDIQSNYDLINPLDSSNDTSDNIYYLVFIKTTSSYNSVPKTSGYYDAYSFTYNMDNKTLVIQEYTIGLIV